MTEPTPVNATAACEAVLRNELRYNVEHGIVEEETVVIERLLGRRTELIDAYAELHHKIGTHPHGIGTFLRTLLTTTAFWHPDRIEQARTDRARLSRVNQLIAERSSELADLLEERHYLHDNCGFSAATHYHVLKIVEEAGAGRYLFKRWVQNPLKSLRGQFDLKYWPRPSEFMRALGKDAERAKPEASDPITAAATEGPRHSRADYFKALYEAIDDNSGDCLGSLPSGFRLTDATIASFANCALDLGPDELVDGAYVKRLRQRGRDGGRKAALD